MTSNHCFVLIRGLLREQRHWGDFSGIMQQNFPTATILTLDIPGNGSLNHLESQRNIKGLCEALRQQTNHSSPVTLVALSMGGMIALEWMRLYPDEINAAILINSSVSNYSPFYQRLKWQIYPTIIRMFFQPAIDRERHILNLTSNTHQHDKTLLKKWQHWQQQKPVSNSNALNQLFAAATFSIKTPPQKPLLVISSKKDRLVDYRCSLKLHQVWHTDFQQHDSAGHDLALDEPYWLARTIKQWMNSHSS